MSGAAMTARELERWLARAVAERCGFEAGEVEVDRPLVDYGFSSRDAVELAGRLEDLLDLTLPTTLVWDHPTIARLAAALAAPAASAAPTAPAAPVAPVAPVAPPVAPASSGRAVSDQDAVAVIGIGCRLPGDVNGPEEFWRLLAEGRDAVGEVPERRWLAPQAAADVEVLERTTRAGGFLSDIAGFDAEFFSISPREARRMDPQQRMILEVGWEALEHAGISPESLRGSATGVFVGVSAGEYGHRSLADLARVDAWSGTGGSLGVTANRLSYALDLRGPSVAVDTACSSSLVAVHLAIQSLRCGDSDLVLAAGANLLLGPAVTAAFHEMGVISPTGRCRPFSAQADGIVRSEGAAVVVLKRLADAVSDGDRILAVLRGSAINQDGHSNGITAPNVEAQEDLLRRAYRAAAIDSGEVDYIEAHGTGTLLGDPIEARALGAVLGGDRGAADKLLVGSVKSNLGHLEAAAGIVGLIKVVLSLGRRRIPASLHYVGDHPHVDFGALGLAVAERLTEWPRAGRPGRAGVSAFGFGGTNAHVIVEEAPAALATFAAPATGAALATGPAPAAEALAPSARIGHYFIGGADVPRLRESAAGLADWLEGEGEGEVAALPDVERTLTRRLCGRARAGVVARDRPSLLAGLRACAAGTSAAGLVERDAGRRDSGPVWVFSGQGSQWPGMALRLLGEEPAFAAALRELDELIAPAAGFSVCEELERREELTAMARLQPVLFAVQVALARLLTAYGVKPAAVVGHSLGEVAAAVTAGALSTADGVRVVTLRSRLLATLAGSGSMALLELSAEELERLLGDGVGVGADGRPGVAVAAFNAPGQIAVAGTAPEVEAVVAAVEARGLLAKLIKSTVPGHCMLVDPVVEDLRAGLAGLAPREPHIPFYGTVLDDARAAPGFGASYWAANIRRPVRFAQAVAAAVADGHASFVEVSPHPVLSHALIDNVHTAGVAQPVVLATGRRSDDERLAFHAGLAALAIEGGVPAELAPPGGRVIDVPRTRWRHAPHWLEAPAPRTSVRAHPLLGERVDLPDPGRRVWRAELDPGLAAGERWMALSTWLEIARCAAGEALPGRDAEVEIGGLVVHAPLALGDRCTVVTTVELTAPRSARLSVQSRIGAGAWRLHVSATVETIPAGGAGAPAPLDAPLHLLLAAQDSPHDFIGNALESLTGALGPVGEGAWLPRSVGRVRWRGDLDAVSSAQMSLGEATAGPERTAALRLLDAHGQVIVDLGEVTFALASRAELPVALSEALLTLDWQPAPAPRATAAGGGTWIVVAADGADPRAQELAAELGARGALAAVVGADGAGEALSAEGPLDGVVVLAGTGGRDGGGRPDDAVSLPDDVPGRRDDVPARGQELLLLGARVVQALTERPGAGAASPAHLWFVTAGAAAVAGGVLSDPGPAALRGLVRVLAYEHPELEPRWVDLDPQRGIEGLISELGAADDEDEVAWRSGRRHVARLGRPELRETGAQSTVHPDGAYLVTGGLGGLGLVLARWLAERGAARVVLNGRSAPDAHAQEELAGLGCEVVVVTGDITQAGVAERAVAACDAPGAHFRGVIHAAAVIEDRVALRLDRESVERVWRAKAHGAWRLSAACEGFELDWWIGFSSAAALIGSPGQAAYAAANAFLDAVVAWRRGRGLPATTINWGTWSQVGAAATRRVDAVTAITPREGLEALEALLLAEVPAAGVLKLDPTALAGSYPELAGIPLFSGLLDAAATDSLQAPWPGVAALDPEQARERIAARVRERIAAVLGAEPGRLDAGAPLRTLGLDSLLAVRIRNALQHDLDVLLPPALLLRGASIDDVLAWLDQVLHLPDARPSSPVMRVCVAPRDAGERLVSAVWEEVLGRSDFGVTESFYELGGDERAAQRAAELISARTGSRVEVGELFVAPTVERQAAVVREPESALLSPVRLLRAGERPRPLFFFHPGGGDTLVYRQLVDHLDPRLTVWGFERLDGVLTVEERAERYLEFLTAKQPSGPYLLAGWSFGGALAYETALRLHAAGERVELVAMIDTILPLPDPPGLSDAKILELRFQRFARFLEDSYGKPVSLPYERMARLDDEAQTEAMIEAIVGAGLIDAHASAAIIRHQRTSYLDVRALERYRPARHDGPVVFYSARDIQVDGIRDPRFDRRDPSRGWEAVCGAHVDVVSVPGHHLSLLDPPHVETIAAHLDQVLGELSRAAA